VNYEFLGSSEARLSEFVGDKDGCQKGGKTPFIIGLSCIVFLNAFLDLGNASTFFDVSSNPPRSIEEWSFKEMISKSVMRTLYRSG
jgi:hypothetical protein